VVPSCQVSVVHYDALSYQSVVSSLVIQRLDYGKPTLTGILSQLMKRVQSVMNAAARIASHRIEIRPHNAAPHTAALADSSEADRVQAGLPGVQMSTPDGFALPR